MSAQSTDRSLLLGLLARQLGFAQRGQFQTAMESWAKDISRELGDILAEQRCLSSEQVTLLKTIVQEHLKQHDDDPAKSLAALNGTDYLQSDLATVQDAQLQATLQKILPSAQSSDPYATVAEDDVTLNENLTRMLVSPDADPHQTVIETPTVAEPQPGTDIPTLGSLTSEGGRFQILRPHARGGLGEVAVAKDAELNRDVALKQIQSSYADDPLCRARFLREAEVTGSLEHPGIVPVYALGSHADGRPFYAMQFIEGNSFQDVVISFHQRNDNQWRTGDGLLELRKMLDRIIDVCNAIEYAHSRGVIHRDLKPDNIMVGKYGATLVVDWGLAKVVHLEELQGDFRPKSNKVSPAEHNPVLTQTGVALGTPAYMSPEQAAGNLDEITEASDVYSLGATLYFLLTNRPPHAGADVANSLHNIQSGTFPRPRELNRRAPRALEEICLKAMSLLPGDRYPSPRDLAADLSRWMADERVTAYEETWSEKLSREGRRHRSWVQACAVALLLVSLSSVAAALMINHARHEAERVHQELIKAEVNSLRNASPAAVSYILDRFKQGYIIQGKKFDYFTKAQPLLNEMLRRAELNDQERVRLQLALLISSREPAQELWQYMLTAPPDEFFLVRDALAPFADQRIGILWSLAVDENNDAPLRLRAACALASYDPDSEQWDQIAASISQQLVGASVLEFKAWNDALRPVRARLVPPLKQIFRESGESQQAARTTAATVLADFAGDQPEELAELLEDADRNQFALIFDQLVKHESHTVPRFQSILVREAAAEPDEQSRQILVSRQANAAIYLLKTQRGESVWPLLRHGPDPRLRSHLIELFHVLDVNPMILVARLGQETDTSIRRALILGLGGFDRERLAISDREAVTALVLNWRKSDPDSGIHAASRWLLQRWHQEVADIDSHLQLNEQQRQRTENDRRRWYVNTQGHTMVIVPDSVGSQPDLDHSFAIASTEVTVEQFLRFRPDHDVSPENSAQADAAIRFVSWYQAAAYCNWLSQQEGIAKQQWCYDADGKFETGMVLPKDYLSRTGYRLPTEQEWENACRAATSTSRHFGETETLLEHYAWYAKNSGSASQRVARLKPNDLGIFDILGNVYEWCNDRFDGAESPRVNDGDDRVWRGGSFQNTERRVRADFRLRHNPSTRSDNIGFRVARTVTLSLPDGAPE